MRDQLNTLYHAWEAWSDTADRHEDGWQSWFPEYDELMLVASTIMTRGDLIDHEIAIVERCWSISDERGELADYAKDHLDDCWMILNKLVCSQDSVVRWQVYDVLGNAGPRAEPILRRAVHDVDGYASRRVILALARLRPRAVRDIVLEFISHQDPYIRRAAMKLAKNSDDRELIELVRNRLAKDSDSYVQEDLRQLG